MSARRRRLHFRSLKHRRTAHPTRQRSLIEPRVRTLKIKIGRRNPQIPSLNLRLSTTPPSSSIRISTTASVRDSEITERAFDALQRGGGRVEAATVGGCGGCSCSGGTTGLRLRLRGLLLLLLLLDWRGSTLLGLLCGGLRGLLEVLRRWVGRGVSTAGLHGDGC